jgi:hypothetical protein
MAIVTKVTVTDGLSEGLKALIDTIDGEEISGLNEAGARSAVFEAVDYHDKFNKAGKWKGPNYLGGPGRDTGDFGANIALGWNFKAADKSGASIANSANHYAFKITGGTIKPKRAKHLTIPMVPEAAGRRVKEYETLTGNRLFRVLGKKALFENTEDGGFRAVYALVKSVTVRPTKGAFPRTEQLAASYAESWLNAANDLL